MEHYQTLQQGSTGQAVVDLQKELIAQSFLEEGQADGIYGPKTAEAVKAYQSKYQLQVDGIAGQQTLGHIASQKAAPPVDTPQTPTATEQARLDLEQLQQEAGQVSQAYQEQLQSLYDQIVSGPGFSYNVNEDALFAQYADQYQRGGILAMQDAMGQAAALAAGYGSSYGQSVGQQAYQQHMAQLANVIPTLEGKAYDRYRQGREDQLEQYALVWQQADDAYNKYLDQLQQQWQELEYQQGREDLNWEREQAQQQDAYNKLTALLSMGYQPTDAELAAAGMTRPQANAILQSYYSSHYTGKASPQDDSINLKLTGYANLNELSDYLTGIYRKQGAQALADVFKIYVQMGVFSQATSDHFYQTILQNAARPPQSHAQPEQVPDYNKF